ncbi:MAG: hypothetical protein ACK4ND_15150 [Cytophagaceae bacterium]
MNNLFSALYLITFVFLLACSSKKEVQKEEHIRISTSGADSVTNAIYGNISLNQLATIPNSVILTGLPDHRLITVYKAKKDGKPASGTQRYSYSYYDEDNNGGLKHFMPGIDLIYGYNLLNIAHYDMKQEKVNTLFEQPVLIKSLYYPSFTPDSLDKKPINRDYYLVSVYDEDTNNDTLINNKDLRRFYHFNSDCTKKTQLIPSDYSVVRSQYDSRNDVMFIFARHDANKNGTGDKNDPMHIFWINLKAPAPAKPMYGIIEDVF